MERFPIDVSQYMTPTPYTIEPAATLDDALAMMDLYKVHHLPVLNEGKIVGLLSLRDLQVLGAHAPASIPQMRVEGLMESHPYCVAPETSLALIAQHMTTQHRNACLIVQEEGHLIGIFTETDAVRALGEFLRQQTRLPKSESHAQDRSDREYGHRPLPRI